MVPARIRLPFWADRDEVVEHGSISGIPWAVLQQDQRTLAVVLLPDGHPYRQWRHEYGDLHRLGANAFYEGDGFVVIGNGLRSGWSPQRFADEARSFAERAFRDAPFAMQLAIAPQEGDEDPSVGAEAEADGGLVDTWHRHLDDAITEALETTSSSEPGLAAQAALQLADLNAITSGDLNALASPLGTHLARRLTGAGWSPTALLLWWTGPDEALKEDRPVDLARRLEAAVAKAQADAQGQVDTW